MNVFSLRLRIRQECSFLTFLFSNILQDVAILTWEVNTKKKKTHKDLKERNQTVVIKKKKIVHKIYTNFIRTKKWI